MSNEAVSIASLFRGWEFLQGQLTGLVEDATPEQLALRSSAAQWPAWATLSHLSGARVYWLCTVFGEPGKERTPFPGAGVEPGWEDDLGHVRTAGELLYALRSSWEVVQHCLARWTPAMLGDEFVRERDDGVRQIHTRQSVLFRILTHDAFHAGGISEVMGVHGIPAIDPWMALSRHL